MSQNTIGAHGVVNPSGAGGVCLYTDDGMSNVAYSFNTCYGSGTYGFLIHGGAHVTHTNEIIDITASLYAGFQQDCTSPSDSACPAIPPGSPMTGDNMTNSIVYSSAAVPTTIWTFLSSSGTANTMTINSNIYYNTTGTFHNSGHDAVLYPLAAVDRPSPDLLQSALCEPRGP